MKAFELPSNKDAKDAMARSAFLKNELRALVHYKGKNRKLNVIEKAATTATQKFRLFNKKEGNWKTTCAVRGLALGGWFVPEKFINIHDWPTPDMPKGVSFKEVADTHGTIYEGSNAPDMCR